MSQEQDPETSLPRLRDRPIIGTPVLDLVAEANVPMRGPFRQRVLDRLRQQARERRTIESVASRVTKRTVSPVANAVGAEVQNTVQNQVAKSMTSTLGPRIQQREEAAENEALILEEREK